MCEIVAKVESQHTDALDDHAFVIRGQSKNGHGMFLLEKSQNEKDIPVSNRCMVDVNGNSNKQQSGC